MLGVFMKNWDDDDNTEHCTARQDFLDVLAVADVLGIEVEAVNFAAEYKERVFSYFLAEYQAGRTPNPDVLCNAEIKFKAFLQDAIARGAEFIATGHYVGKGADAAGRATLLQAFGRQQGSKLFPLSPLARRSSPPRCSRWRICPSPKCARSQRRSACPTPPRRTAPASASSASATSANSSNATCRATPARCARPKANASASTRA